MRPEVADQLLALNRAFYAEFAGAFARSRVEPQPGFFRLLEHLPERPLTVLDVGCGNGRWGEFLYQQGRLASYTGVDSSLELMAQAEQLNFAPDFLAEADMAQPGFLEPFGSFDLISCLAALQHVPGGQRRAAVVQEMADHLRPDGLIACSNWQFLDSPRQRRKLLPWEEIGLSASDVEPGDHLLSWRRGGFGRRYVRHITAQEMAALAAAAGLEVVAQFRADGREGDLSLYTLLRNGR